MGDVTLSEFGGGGGEEKERKWQRKDADGHINAKTFDNNQSISIAFCVTY